jgi:hypothetical protein
MLARAPKEAQRRGVPIGEQFVAGVRGSEPRPAISRAGDRNYGARPRLALGKTCKEKPSFMAKRKAVVPDTLGDDILDRLRDLHRQATVERSHYYTGRCFSDAINEITRLRKLLGEL